LRQGEATLTVDAVDHALLRFFRGNAATVSSSFTVDVTPPMLEVFSAQHYINQGGSECVVYRVSDDAEISGVQAGPHFFPGYPVSKADPKIRFALFALAYDQPVDTKFRLLRATRPAMRQRQVSGKKFFLKNFAAATSRSMTTF
jgi:hypothetical protein